MAKRFSILAGREIDGGAEIHKAPSPEELLLQESQAMIDRLTAEKATIEANLIEERKAKDEAIKEAAAIGMAKTALEGRLATETALRQLIEATLAEEKARVVALESEIGTANTRASDQAVARAKVEVQFEAARAALVDVRAQLERERKAVVPPVVKSAPASWSVDVKRDGADKILGLEFKPKVLS